ncbi:MAG: acyl-CoA/acyl-ACP dehydrogenase [Pseudomonadales bacterium]|nr:acyl-CoA/acyl-ACP dehydrogenase [Pseudomonadales bacterium]
MSNQINFTEEQSMLLDTAMSFCQSHSPIETVRHQIENHKFDAEQWQAMVELGWLGISIPEKYAGLGLGLGEVVPIVESMGRNLMVSPFLASTLATQVLVHGDNENLKNKYLPNIVNGSIATLAIQELEGAWDINLNEALGKREGELITLSGTKFQVLDLDVAEIVIISILLDKQVVLICIDQKEIPPENIKREIVIDETRNSFSLDLNGLKIQSSALVKLKDLKVIEQSALLLLSAEMCGGLASTLNTIIDYLNTRKQFDRLIGSYQALKHPTVDILLALEALRSHLYYTAGQFGDGDSSDGDLEVALHMCKALASESFAYAGDRCIQFHGGFGFTYECDAQLFLRRAIWSQYQFGDEKYHRQLLAKLLLDECA